MLVGDRVKRRWILRNDTKNNLDINQEVRILNAFAKLIENYINFDTCCFKYREKIITTVLPQNQVAKKYFYIMVLEIISVVSAEMIPNKNNGDSLLDLLQKIASSPNLGEVSDVHKLLMATENFILWLNYEFEYPIYSNNIGKEIRIKLTRRKALYLVGNYCKHSLVRLNKAFNEMVNIYKNSGIDLDVGTELMILEDIDDWLFHDFGGYHFTKLCELSSEVYHGIMQYTCPIRKRRIKWIDEVRYTYDIPFSVKKQEDRFELYELLNRSRNSRMPIIKTWESLQEKNYL